jgi:hypothetical protein
MILAGGTRGRIIGVVVVFYMAAGKEDTQLALLVVIDELLHQVVDECRRSPPLMRQPC